MDRRIPGDDKKVRCESPRRVRRLRYTPLAEHLTVEDDTLKESQVHFLFASFSSSSCDGGCSDAHFCATSAPPLDAPDIAALSTPLIPDVIGGKSPKPKGSATTCVTRHELKRNITLPKHKVGAHAAIFVTTPSPRSPTTLYTADRAVQTHTPLVSSYLNDTCVQVCTSASCLHICRKN